MNGEFIGVWSEMLREIWGPLCNEALDNNEEFVSDDIFCELYRELTKILKEPTPEKKILLILEDPIMQIEFFEFYAKQENPELTLEYIDDIYHQSGASESFDINEKKSIIKNKITSLLGHSPVLSIDEQFYDFMHKASFNVKEIMQRKLEKLINDKQMSREAFVSTKVEDLSGERNLVKFLESSYDILEEFGGEQLANRYYDLLSKFIRKFSLRYDLCTPCIICPTLPGVFASLFSDLRELTTHNNHLDMLMKEFEESIRDLRIDCSERRIKTCIQKQVNLLEALSWETLNNTDTEGRQRVKEDKRKALSSYAKNASWPHDDVLSTLLSLYSFTCDYPGIRHGGTPEHAKRSMDMRDMVAISILLTGFTPYLSHQINAETVYQRV